MPYHETINTVALYTVFLIARDRMGLLRLLKALDALGNPADLFSVVGIIRDDYIQISEAVK